MTAITTVVDDLDPVTRCRICGRELHAERSRRLCVGPVCRHKIAASVVVPGWRVETVVAADRGAITLVLVPLVVAP